MFKPIFLIFACDVPCTPAHICNDNEIVNHVCTHTRISGCCLNDTECAQDETCIEHVCTENDPPQQDRCGETIPNESGAGCGTRPDGTPDDVDNDGDCVCEVGPCSSSLNPYCETLVGGDCDDKPLDYNVSAVCSINGNLFI